MNFARTINLAHTLLPTLVLPGTGYTPGATTAHATIGGAGASCTVDIVADLDGKIKSLTINNPGNGAYVNGNTLTIAGGNADATFTVQNFPTDMVVLEAEIFGQKFGLQVLYADTTDSGTPAELLVEGSAWEHDVPANGWATITTLNLSGAGNSGDILDLQVNYTYARVRTRMILNGSTAGTVAISMETE
jgi:hypothetical protein